MRSALVAFLLVTSPVFAQPPGEPPFVAPTNALSPADERKAFTVPPGFDVQLVASEPDIQKPIQMAFDAKGRLWVTTSHHYPFPAEKGKASDKLFILSDFDPNGKAKKVQLFADDLNIPIGILPLPDCKSCIVSCVGEIRKYTDTTGGGKADKMEVLFTGFGTRDTHGQNNSYTLMPDGWVYACHGYANDSTVRGKDGHEVKMNSGNTFRFRPDGSRIEVYTHGQVNPFGIAVDPWFNLYTADCHSMPITQLIPDAYYISFGKPNDGLGFAPHVTQHHHGSTALCGLTWYDANQFPKEYLGCMFLGNVVTSRINFDKIEWKGATPVGKELPDFLVSKDPWFRPTDIKLGPDGALYVSDFYNKIIGHYEVDLKDPRRDKDRGRVWRIVWKGLPGGEPVPPPKFAYSDLTTDPIQKVHLALGSNNLMVRLQATLQMQLRLDEYLRFVRSKKGGFLLSFDSDVFGPAHKEWSEWPNIPERGNQLAANLEFARKDPAIYSVPVDVHRMRMAATVDKWDEKRALGGQLRPEIVRALQRKDPHVLIAAVEVVIYHPHADFVPVLLDVLKKCDPEDTHLHQAAKIALRNCLRDDEKAWPPYKNIILLREGFDPAYADIALAIPTEIAAGYLLSQIMMKKITEDKLSAAAEHIARYGSKRAEDENVFFGVLTTLENSDVILAAFKGVQARGAKLDGLAAKYVLDSAERAATSGDFPVGGPTPAELRSVQWGLRVLNALPTVCEEITSSKDYGLKPRSVELLGKLVGNANAPVDVRIAATEVLIRYSPDEGLKIARKLVAAPNTPDPTRERLLIVLASSRNKDARLDARDALKDAPYRTAVAVGVALAGTPLGADDLLTAVKTGKAPARLLQEKAILERLHAANIPDLDKQIAALTKGLPALDARLAELIKKRATAFASAKPDKELGAKVFTKHCAACHRIADMGGKIAPNLDGIGVRGLERILEDTLDPNRNVDQAFRARVITTKDEKTITGLMLRVEGEVLIVADGEGKEIRIPTKDIATNRETMLSPMPANFGDVIPEADFMHLIAYLLDQRAKEPPKKKE
jgi:putative heme-binding domain-containing protein